MFTSSTKYELVPIAVSFRAKQKKYRFLISYLIQLIQVVQKAKTHTHVIKFLFYLCSLSPAIVHSQRSVKEKTFSTF